MKKIACFWVLFLLTIVSVANGKQARKFYLTQNIFTGSEALTACAKDYHMASVWEILDVSNLKYNTKLGLTLPDAGFGPPIDFGWIRTGSDQDNSSNTPGIANCLAYSSDIGTGSAVRLNDDWASPIGSPIHPWTFGEGVFDCATKQFVWCVSD